jgi:hypothetical protein
MFIGAVFAVTASKKVRYIIKGATANVINRQWFFSSPKPSTLDHKKFLQMSLDCPFKSTVRQFEMAVKLRYGMVRQSTIRRRTQVN